MMKKFSTLICMLLCMYFLSPVLANEISPVKSHKDDAEKKAALLASWYAPGLEVSNLYFEQIDLLFTDNSYADVSYTLWRQVEGSATWEYLYDFNLPDSGSVLTLTDNVLPGTSYNYSISVTLEDGTTLSDVALVSATSPLEPPKIEYDDMYMYDCGSEIPIQVDFIYTGAYTEIYHALSPSGPWHLESTLPPGTRNALFDVSPRQTHYFRARGTNAAHDTFSDWSNVISRHVESDWYDPTFTVTVLPDRTVDIKLVMRTFVNAEYAITRMSDDSFTVMSGLETSDSSAVFTFHDTTVEPGKTYEYILSAYQSPILCVAWPGGGDRDTDIARVYVTIPPDDYTINGFTLVDPATDQDIGPLTNNLQFEANLLPNIRANVGPHVKSVIFFLNNKRRTDNGPPLFTYFPANNNTGDYEPGVWLPGNYTLEATAYSEKNGKGIKGTTLEIFFQVLPTVHLDSLVLIDPVTNAPIRRLRNFDTVDASLNANIRAYTSSNAKCVTFFLNNKRRTDNGPPEFTYFALGTGGLSVPGQYILLSTASTEKNGKGFVGYTFYTNFTVVGGSASATPLAARSETEESSVSLYPNPIGNNSRLQISAPVSASVNVQLYDQFGSPLGKPIEVRVDDSGQYQLPLKELRLGRGAYIMSVKIDGVRTIKRFVVE